MFKRPATSKFYPRVRDNHPILLSTNNSMLMSIQSLWAAARPRVRLRCIHLCRTTNRQQNYITTVLEVIAIINYLTSLNLKTHLGFKLVVITIHLHNLPFIEKIMGLW